MTTKIATPQKTTNNPFAREAIITFEEAASGKWHYTHTRPVEFPQENQESKQASQEKKPA